MVGPVAFGVPMDGPLGRWGVRLPLGSPVSCRPYALNLGGSVLGASRSGSLRSPAAVKHARLWTAARHSKHGTHLSVIVQSNTGQDRLMLGNSWRAE